MAAGRRKRPPRIGGDDCPIDVLGSGAVVLGPKVTCDGFQADRLIRVQTHIHSDHMADFTTSLRGRVIMTEPTRRLLEHEHPALPSRANVIVLEPGSEVVYEGNTIQLLSSDHTLGGVQVKVTLENGVRVGYSSDFNWPLRDVIKVDGLVVDATYGCPAPRSPCDQGRAQEALVDLVRKGIRQGPVHLMADTGPLERGLTALALSDVIMDIPIIGNRRICWFAQVSREYGRHVPDVMCEGTKEALRAMSHGCFVRVWSLSSQLPNDGLYEGTALRLTKYRTGREPWQQVGDGVYHVAFSNHADFQGTMKYVEATGAGFVVTDNFRGHCNRRAEQLAKAIRSQLRVKARVSENVESLEWGQ